MARNLVLTDKVTIASSGTASTALTLQGGRIPLAILTPAALTGTEFKFQASIDGNNFFALYNGATELAITVNTSRYIALNPDIFASVRYLKIISGSSESAARDIYVISGEV